MKTILWGRYKGREEFFFRRKGNFQGRKKENNAAWKGKGGSTEDFRKRGEHSAEREEVAATRGAEGFF